MCIVGLLEWCIWKRYVSAALTVTVLPPVEMGLWLRWKWFCWRSVPEGADRRPINLIIRVESQIGGISRQELSAKAADLKMSVNLTRLAAHYFYKLTFCFQSAKVIPMFYEWDNVSSIDRPVLTARQGEGSSSERLPCSEELRLILVQGQTLCSFISVLWFDSVMAPFSPQGLITFKLFSESYRLDLRGLEVERERRATDCRG